MKPQNENPKLLEAKIITLGDSQVGKSSFILKFIEDKFSQSYLSTIGLDFKQKNITLPNGTEVKIRIFDTAGEDRFKSIAANYIKKAEGVLLIYDITKEDTFENVNRWMNDIKSNSGDKISIVLVGNKIDLESERKVSKEMGETKGKEYGIHFYETSCKTGVNVNKTFVDLAEQILSKKKLDKSEGDRFQMKKKTEKNNENKCTC